MTGKDGNALCREVRSDETLAKTVMIASSASVYEGDRHDAESAGFDDFLPKPVKESELLQILERHMRLKWIVGTDLSSNGSTANAAIRTTGIDPRPPTNGESLPVERLLQLLTLAGEGDVVALRRALEQIAENDPAHAALAKRLLPLVAAYRIDDVETILQQTIGQPAGSSKQ
jgi:DNA-binding response OmpR family regulator